MQQIMENTYLYDTPENIATVTAVLERKDTSTISTEQKHTIPYIVTMPLHCNANGSIARLTDLLCTTNLPTHIMQNKEQSNLTFMPPYCITTGTVQLNSMLLHQNIRTISDTETGNTPDDGIPYNLPTANCQQKTCCHRPFLPRKINTTVLARIHLGF